MPHRDTAPTGAPCWIDLMTSDPDGARSFYGELFGWEFEDPNEEFGGYANARLGDDLVAGLMGRTPEMEGPDTWSVYLAVDDAQATTDAATAAGATVIAPPMAVGTLGTMAVLVDPGGAVVGMWQPGEHPGFTVLAESGAPGWFEQHSRSYDRAVAFYEDVFGWTTHVESDTEDFRYSTLGEGDGALAGVMDDSPMPDEHPPHWAVYFQVEDADKAVAEVERLGGAVVMAPEDTPYGRLAVATDPSGAAFRLVAP